MFGLFCLSLKPSSTNCFRSNNFTDLDYQRPLTKTEGYSGLIRKRIKDKDTRSVLFYVYGWFPSFSGLASETEGNLLLVASFGAENIFRHLVLSPS
jgi:hypothetical protein